MAFNFITPREKYYYQGLPSLFNTRNIGTSIGGAGGVDSGLIFSILDTDSGYSKLPTTLQINEQTVDAMFIYRGHEATTSSWTAYVGQNVEIVGEDADVIPNQYTPFTSTSERAIRIRDDINTKYFTSSDDLYCNLDFNDFIFEVVSKVTGSTQTFFSKYNISTSHGYAFSLNGGRPQVTFRLSSSFNPTLLSSTTLVTNTWNHIMAFADRTGNLRFYVNGRFATQHSMNTATGSVNKDNQFFNIGSLGRKYHKWSG